MASYALMAGAKGIGYYWWPRMAGNAELLRGLSDVNGRLQQIGGLAVRSVPVGWVKSSHPKTLIQALWTAGEGLVVLLTNEDYTTDPSAEGKTVVKPLGRIKLSCRLPEGAENWRLFRVTPLAWEPIARERFAIEQTDGDPRMVWTIPELTVADWFVIAGGPY